jgi:hypothetical protein
MRKDLSIRFIEEALKRALMRGELVMDWTDEEIEFLLRRSEPVRPSRDFSNEIEKILLRAVQERKADVVAVGGEKLSEARGRTAVSKALSEAFRISGWGIEEAAQNLAITPNTLKKILSDNISVATTTAREVASVLAARHGLTNQARDLLIQWLLNGLHLIDLRESAKASGSMRAAARKTQKKRKKR